MIKPYSQACENNKQPILKQLKHAFENTSQVLEVGSGSGQHAIHFAQHLPHLNWQTSDVLSNHNGINQWIAESEMSNIGRPLNLDLNQSWPVEQVDGIFTANTLHIVNWWLVIKFFEGVSRHLVAGGMLCIYGPFNYDSQFTSDSNREFDLWLKERDPQSGIRNIEAIYQLANQTNLTLIDDHPMPANNRLLVFKKNE